MRPSEITCSCGNKVKVGKRGPIPVICRTCRADNQNTTARQVRALTPKRTTVRLCAYCNIEFSAIGNTRYCSDEHRATARSEQRYFSQVINRTCVNCNNHIPKTQDFCSEKCWRKTYVKGVPICSHCNNEPRALRPRLTYLRHPFPYCGALCMHLAFCARHDLPDTTPMPTYLLDKFRMVKPAKNVQATTDANMDAKAENFFEWIAPRSIWMAKSLHTGVLEDLDIVLNDQHIQARHLATWYGEDIITSQGFVQPGTPYWNAWVDTYPTHVSELYELSVTDLDTYRQWFTTTLGDPDHPFEWR